MRRIRAVPVIAVTLAVAATGILLLLQAQESASRDAQLDLQTVKLELSDLQLAPFSASKSTGGSPAVARGLIEGNRREIASTLERLDEAVPPGPPVLRGAKEIPGALDGLPALMAENGAQLDRIYELGASPVGYQAEADGLAGEAAESEAQIVALLDEASGEYDERAATAAARAEIGEVAAIVLLLAAFGFYYRRSLRAARANRGMLVTAREEALTDALTGLNNRRALITDLDQGVQHVSGTGTGDVDDSGGDQLMLSMFDLDGFKQYNDTFGHPAGDALLRRLGRRLQAPSARGRPSTAWGATSSACSRGSSGTMRRRRIAELGVAALSERGRGFEIGCSQGSALIPSEAEDAEAALTLADERMYEQKAEGASASRQSSDVLQRVLAEKSASLSEHLSGVGALAEPTALALGLSEPTARRVKTAAELHDVGKTGIPDAILDKPAPLDDDEIRVHGAPHPDRRAHPPRSTLARSGRRVRALPPRADGRHRLPGRAQR